MAGRAVSSGRGWMSVRSAAGSIRVMMRQNALSAGIRRYIKIKDTGRDFLEEVMGAG